MLTENDARELLRRAAATVDVGPGAPFAPPGRRRWLVPAVAAVAVLAAVVAGALVVDDGQHARSPLPAATRPPTPSPSPVDPAAVAIADQLLLFAAGGSEGFPGRGSVRFYTEGTFWNVLTDTQADRLASYSLCSGIGPPQCTASYLAALRPPGAHTVTAQLPSCYDRDRLVGQGRGGGARTAFVVSEADGGCAWAVQLRYDPPTGLVAVNAISTTPDPERDAREVADRFIAFARGTSEGPPVDTPVRLFQDQVLVRTLSAAEAGLRASYQRCGAQLCRFSAVQRIRDVLEVPALRRSPDVPACLAAPGTELTAKETGGSTSVLVSDVDAPCAWGVQLWINDVGQVVALDLRTGRR